MLILANDANGYVPGRRIGLESSRPHAQGPEAHARNLNTNDPKRIQISYHGRSDATFIGPTVSIRTV